MSSVQAKDDRALVSSKVEGLQAKRDNSCGHLRQSQTSPKASGGHLGSQITSIVGFQVLEDGKTNVNDASRSSTPSDSKDASSFMSRDSQHFSTTRVSSPTNLLSKGSNMNLLSNICESEIPPKVIEDQGLCSPFSSTSFSVQNGLTSPTSVISRTMDLNLGINSHCACRELDEPTNNGCLDLVQNPSSCFSGNPDVSSENISFSHSKSSSCSHSDIHSQVDEQDYKKLYKALAKRVGRQEEALQVVCRTISRCRTTNENRGGVIWFHFVGPDRLAKKELAIALAEFHGSIENLIHVNLSLQLRSDCDGVGRGEIVVDYIGEKLCKRPFSVLLLENVEKADSLLQRSLSNAVKKGRFTYASGRDFGIIGKFIIVTTSRFKDGEEIMHPGAVAYSEDDVLTVKGLPIQMMIGFDLGDHETNQNLSMMDTKSKASSNRIFRNKRKLIGRRDTSEQCGSLKMAKRHKAWNASLDLNVPADEDEICDADSRTWLEDLLGEVDALVTFQPCDFDTIAQQIQKDISECFQKLVGSECSLEIDSGVMVQMVAAAYFRDKKTVEEWIQHVVGNGFERAQEKYSLNSRSTIKLVVREEILAEDQTPSELLPSRIIVP